MGRIRPTARLGSAVEGRVALRWMVHHPTNDWCLERCDNLVDGIVLRDGSHHIIHGDVSLVQVIPSKDIDHGDHHIVVL